MLGKRGLMSRKKVIFCTFSVTIGILFLLFQSTDYHDHVIRKLGKHLSRNLILKLIRNESNNQTYQKSFLNETQASETVKILNDLGRKNQSSEEFILRILAIVDEGREDVNQTVFRRVLKDFEDIRKKDKKKDLRKLNVSGHRPNITVAMIVCGDRVGESGLMLKSLIMFSMDANLHVVVVSDRRTVFAIGAELLLLKAGLAEIGYFGFTYELHLEWYPKEVGGPDWKSMYRKCATQRLFFPSLLKEHDAVIYLDTDVLVMSNLTEIWQIFQEKMGDSKMVGVTPNSESPGWYNKDTFMPYFGAHGINAGILLMNLTQLRAFKFESRAKAIYTAYDSKIILADQDVINAIYHSFPDEALDITCAYNFYWHHCNYSEYNCYVENGTKNICFCNSAIDLGVRILHGNSGSFWIEEKLYPFFYDTSLAFENLDIYTASYSSMLKDLRKKFNEVQPSPCFPMTADILYGNADHYLGKLEI